MFSKYMSLSVCVGFFFFLLNIILCIFQGQSGKLLARSLPSIIPGSEIPSWLRELKIWEEPHSSFVKSQSSRKFRFDHAIVNRFKTKKVNIQVPCNGCNEWEGILLCLVFVPRERPRRPSNIDVYSIEVDGRPKDFGPFRHFVGFNHCKFESHHLWLVYYPLYIFDLPNHCPYMMSRPCGSINAKGFHQVEIKIATVGVELEKIGFGLVYKEVFLEGTSNRSVEKRICREYLLL